jgi:transcriptional regulator of acetoin/glycerol metabolism
VIEKFQDWKKRAVREYFDRLLAAYPRVADAARASGINRTDFYKQLRRVGIETNTENRGNEAWRSLEDK